MYKPVMQFAPFSHRAAVQKAHGTDDLIRRSFRFISSHYITGDKAKRKRSLFFQFDNSERNRHLIMRFATI